jgi:uncharacterized membrane protein HdeD (DUF308 family)
MTMAQTMEAEGASAEESNPVSTRAFSIVVGVIFILAGLVSIAMPLIATRNLTLIVGALLIVVGFAQVAQGISRTWGSFFLHLLLGLLYVAAGVGFWLNPVSGAVVLTLVLAWLLIIQGAGEIALGFSARQHEGRGWLVLAGGISIVAGLWLLFRAPALGLVLPGVFLGVALLVEGAAFLSMRRV